MKLVEDWKDAWRWISMNFMVLAAAIQGAWLAIPEDMRTSIPAWIVSAITIILLFIGIIGRLLKQDKKTKRVKL